MRTPARPRILAAFTILALLAACHGTRLTQPEAAGAAPENAASVEAVNWSAGGVRSTTYKASIVGVWDSKGNKLFGGLSESYPRVTLKPGAYEFLIKCEADKTYSPPRTGLRLAANQKFTLHCEPRAAGTPRVVARNLADPAAPADPSAAGAKSR